MIQQTITALLVGKKDGCLAKLEQCLADMGLKTTYVERASQVPVKLREPEAPQLIFAATEPADKSWPEVIDAARESGKRAVILASRVIDDSKYLDALERGAFDFVVPPFHPRDLRHVLDSAISGSPAWT